MRFSEVSKVLDTGKKLKLKNGKTPTSLKMKTVYL